MRAALQCFSHLIAPHALVDPVERLAGPPVRPGRRPESDEPIGDVIVDGRTLARVFEQRKQCPQILARVSHARKVAASRERPQLPRRSRLASSLRHDQCVDYFRQAMICSTDPDFRVCLVDFDVLLEIQRHAEERRWGTRWSSIESLRSQVQEGPVLLRSLMREKRGGVVRAYRCLVLFSARDTDDSGGVATVDVDPDRFFALERLDRDVAVRRAFARIFDLALGGISMVSKN